MFLGGVGRLMRAISSGTAFTPVTLFSSGEQGAWYDPSDFSSMFQDAAGSTPVTAVEQPVGRILDKSGRGNNATQSTSSARPVLSARYNLFVKTENLADTATWGTSFVSGGTRSGGSLTLNATESYVYFYQDVSLIAAPYVFTADVVSNQTISNVPFRISFGASGWTALLSMTANVTYRLSIAFTPAAGTGGLSIGLDNRSSINPGGSTATGYTVTFNRLDLRITNNGLVIPAYQSVTSSTNYDIAGFPVFLRFDGVDDYLATGNINGSASQKGQMFVGAGTPAAHTGVIGETGSGSDIGTFHLAVLGSNFYQAYSIGGTSSTPVTSSVSFPNTNTITNITDFSSATPFIGLRVGGVQTNQSTSSIGATSFANLPLYLGVRNTSAFPYAGNMYGFVLRFGANLSEDTIFQTESYLASKSGVAVTKATIPVNTAVPTISGTLSVGSTLTATTGSWSGTTPYQYTYVWNRDGSPISGATSSTYVLVTADVGTTVTVTVTATNQIGSTAATSAGSAIPSGSFSPTSLFTSGAQGAWYDPSDFSTMFQDWQGTTAVTATGQPVGKILDKSGNNNHLYQGTAGNRPLLQQDGSGKYYLDFDGTNDYMFTGQDSGGTLIDRAVPFATSGTQSVTVFAGARKGSDSAIRCIVSSNPFENNSNSFYLRAPGTAGVSNYSMRASGDVDISSATATGYTAPITNVVTGIATPNTSTILLRVNGTQVASQTATLLGSGPFADDVMYLGSVGTAQRFFSGRIYSTIVLGRLTTGTELSDTETWVNGKTAAY